MKASKLFFSLQLPVLQSSSYLFMSDTTQHRITIGLFNSSYCSRTVNLKHDKSLNTGLKHCKLNNTLLIMMTLTILSMNLVTFNSSNIWKSNLYRNTVDTIESEFTNVTLAHHCKLTKLCTVLLVPYQKNKKYKKVSACCQGHTRSNSNCVCP